MLPTRIHKTLCGLTLLSCLAAASPALAQESDDDRAFELFRNGQQLYNEGRYEAAVLAWEEAYKLSGRHKFLLNIANSHERAGNYEAALDALARFQAFAPADMRDEIARRKAQVEKRLEETKNTTTPAPQPDPKPQPRPDPVSPTPQPAPVPAPAPRASGGGGGKKVAGAVLIGVGVAAIGGGVGLGVVSAGAKRRADDQCQALDDLKLCPTGAAGDLSTHRLTSILADTAFAVGALSTVAGVVLVVSSKGGKRTAVTFAPTRVGLTGTF